MGATMPSYPHYKPGDTKPNDKLLILEDTNGDGQADQQTIFADGLHLPIGFELASEGVYISQGNHLKLLKIWTVMIEWMNRNSVMDLMTMIPIMQ